MPAGISLHNTSPSVISILATESWVTSKFSIKPGASNACARSFQHSSCDPGCRFRCLPFSRLREDSKLDQFPIAYSIHVAKVHLSFADRLSQVDHEVDCQHLIVELVGTDLADLANVVLVNRDQEHALWSVSHIQLDPVIKLGDVV